MKPSKPFSPDILRLKKNELVPLKHPFPKSQIKELPGWRSSTTTSPKLFKIVPSKLFKVKRKGDFYSPLRFATDNRLPIILEPNKSASTSNLRQLLNKKTIELNYLKKNLIIESRGQVLSRNYNYEMPAKTQVLLKDHLTYSEKTEKNNFSSQNLDLGLIDKSKSLSPVTKIQVSDCQRSFPPVPEIPKRRKSENLCEKKLRSYLIVKKIKTRFKRSKSINESECSRDLFRLHDYCQLTKTIELLSQVHSEDSSYLLPSKSTSVVNNDKTFSLNDNTNISYSKISNSEDLLTKSFDKNLLTPNSLKKSSTKLLDSTQQNQIKQLTRSRTSENKSQKPDEKKSFLVPLKSGTHADSTSFDSSTGRSFSHNSVKQSPDLEDSKGLAKSKTFLRNPSQCSDEEKNLGQAEGIRHSNTQKIKRKIGENLSLKVNPSNPQRSSKMLASNNSAHSANTPNPNNNPYLSVKPDQGKVIKSSLKKLPTLNSEENDLVKGLKNCENQLVKQKFYGSPKVSFKGIKSSSSEEESSTPKIKITEIPKLEKTGSATEKIDDKKLDGITGKHKGKNSDARSQASNNENSISQADGKKRISSKKGSKRFDSINSSKKKVSLSPRSHQTETEDDKDSSEIDFDYNSYLNDSEVSRISYMTRMTNEMKNGKMSLINFGRKNTGRKTNLLSFLKSSVLQDDQKKTGNSKLSPVANFIFNFSFNILKFLKALSKLEAKKKRKSLERKNLLTDLNQEIAEKDNLSSGKLRVNRPKAKEHKQINPVNNAVTRRTSKKLRKIKIDPTYYPREINLKAMHSIKAKQEKINSHRISLKHKDALDGSYSDYSSEETEAKNQSKSISKSSSMGNVSSRKHSLKKTIKKDLFYLIARHIIEAKDEEKTCDLEESCLEPKEDSGDDMEKELFKLKKRLKKNNKEFAFGHEINFRVMQRNSKKITFKDIENGYFEPDMENLMRSSEKHIFLESKNILKEKYDSYESGGLLGVKVLPNEWMTEEQMYKDRMKKVGICRKRLEKRREIRPDFTGKVEVEGKDSKNWDMDCLEYSLAGGTFEERVYFRLKGPGSPVFYNDKLRFN